MKDLYKVLGVSSKASSSDIVKAYRRMASQYHPDRNKFPQAKEMFQAVFDAYSILSDESRRKDYDHEMSLLKKSLKKSEDPLPNPEQESVLNLKGQKEQIYKVQISLEEAFYGCDKIVSVQILKEGKLKKQKIKIPINRGVIHKQILEIETGNRSIGSIFVRVLIKKHPLFKTKKEDLILILPISITDAVLGAHVRIPTLEGEIEFAIPPSTHAGSMFLLGGQGLLSSNGKRGNLVVQIHIDIPSHITEKERQWMKQFIRRETPLVSKFNLLVKKSLSKKVA